MATQPEQQFIEATVQCAVRGYHVYKEVWRPYIGDEFLTFHKNGNTKDKYAIAVTPADSKSECKQIVGHLPKEISKICFYFIAHRGIILVK